jgi:hypothetical protein
MKPNKLVFEKFKGRIFAKIIDENSGTLAVSIIDVDEVLKEMQLFKAFLGPKKEE